MDGKRVTTGGPAHGRGGGLGESVGGGTPRGRGGGHISSLFSKLPDMPPVLADLHRRTEPHTTNAPIFSAQTFSDLKLEPKMVANLRQTLRITTMTSAQKQAIPHLLMSRDVLLKSPTGTGKTLAYAVPMIQRLQSLEPKVKREDGPLAIVVTPTRELALQTLEVLQQLLQPYVNIVPGLIIGGEKKKSEKARIRKGMNIIVATPGRLVDHIRTTECLSLAKLQWLVFDEADRYVAGLVVAINLDPVLHIGHSRGIGE